MIWPALIFVYLFFAVVRAGFVDIRTGDAQLAVGQGILWLPFMLKWLAVAIIRAGKCLAGFPA